MKNRLKFDLIVIGTGAAGTTTAIECRSKGWKVAIIDSLPFGGTCALRGCEPKKVLNEAAKIIDLTKNHQNKGIDNTKDIRIKWRELIQFKRTFTDSFPKQREEIYIKHGIIPYHGTAKFIDKNKLIVESNNTNKNFNETKDDNILHGKYILIATGSQPIDLGIEGSEYVLTSDQFLEYSKDRLPDKVVFIGGGYISFEFAHIAARSGSKVTILHRGKKPLESFDPDLVNLLIKKSNDIGIDIKLQAAVKRICKSETKQASNNTFNCNGRDKYSLSIYFSNNSDISNDHPTAMKMSFLDADMVVHGAGRIPDIESLDLKAGKIEYTKRGIKVNDYLQSVSNPVVYAAGDVADNKGLPLTPVATYEGNIVSNNLLYGNTFKTDYKGLPSVAFTIPAIASAGLNEKDAKEQGLLFRVKHQETSGWYSSRRVGETCSAFKLLIEEKSERILGAHLIGPHAEEVINIFSMAIRFNLSTKDLNNPLLYAYPTNSSDVLYML